MKHFCCCVPLFFLSFHFCQAQASPPTESQRSYLELPFSTLVPFQDEQSALTLDLSKSLYYRNLTKLWRSGNTAKSLGAGAFTTTFQLPEAWQNRQTFLCFAPLKAPIRVLVNGSEVETLKEEFPAKLNITSFLQHNENEIEVQPVGEQKQQSFTLLADSAYLFSGANIHVKDIEEHGMPGGVNKRTAIPRVGSWYIVKDFNGISWHTDNFNYNVKLYNRLGSEETNFSSVDHTRAKRLAPGSQSVWGYSTPVTGKHFWSAEDPYLHTVTHVIRDKTPAKEIQEIFARKLGLRQVFVKDKQLYLNHTPIKLNFVRYELPAANAALSAEHFENLVKELKQHNINTLIISGSPLPHLKLYELCDQYGLYIIQQLDPTLNGGMDDKTKATLYALRNYASLLGWYIPAKGTEKLPPQPFVSEVKKITYYTPILNSSDFPKFAFASRWNNLNEQKKLDLKRVYQRVYFLPEPGEGGASIVKVVNQYDFIPLENLRLEWQVKENGVTIREGKESGIALAASGRTEISLPFNMSEYQDSTRYSFVFSLKMQEITPWSQPGHEFAKENFVFSSVANNAAFLKRVLAEGE